MELNTTRFGVIEVDPARIITFPRGFIGFPSWRRFVLLPHGTGGDSPFWVLQSAEDPDLAFVVVDPRHVYPGYVARVPASHLAEIGIDGLNDVDRAVVLALVTLRPGTREATANLKAPLVINPSTRQGLQVILDGAEYAIRHPIFPHDARMASQKETQPALVTTD
ncbi:MAG: flagellar assembly protein FliW [Limnochordaceae bacterium]|uniref:Flagellar assembly factor FliW n=1 Tax=Carboxydichorda subterranea TaxID=3109565 RepID=A0ABZ1BYT4_9FIRM|nr:flagellar assembly protein FliW [Limnochorda sp. L945t]MBE3598858.1 flagellar assembly protein FliW [Limnochordaceae bacterium]WRP17884.1 flagellar assembly protein FliW [Limnochorda sp. L945t]